LGGDRLTGPRDAYKYFKGEPIKHPLGFDVKIDTPLDWAGVTDHSEYVGVTKLANDPSTAISKLPAAQPSRCSGSSNESLFFESAPRGAFCTIEIQSGPACRVRTIASG
jgi:hypothetical protein